MRVSAPGLAGVASRAAVQHIPLEVSLELTHRCSFRCVHCYLPDHTAVERFPVRRLLGILDELTELGTLFVAISGGEPLLHPDWRLVVRHGRRRGFVVRLLTNGLLMTADDAAVLADLCVRVSISLYAADAGVFERITGMPGSYARVMESVDCLQRAGVLVSFKVPLMRSNAEAIASVAAFAAACGVPYQVYPIVSHGRSGSSGPLRERAGTAALRAFYTGPHSPRREPVVVSPHPPAERAPCAAGIRSATITPTGDVLACSLLPTVAGNVAERSFREVWETSPWLQILRALRVRDLPACAGCSRLAYCGRCPARALVEGEGLKGADPVACAAAEMIEQAWEGSATIQQC